MLRGIRFLASTALSLEQKIQRKLYFAIVVWLMYSRRAGWTVRLAADLRGADLAITGALLAFIGWFVKSWVEEPFLREQFWTGACKKGRGLTTT